MSQIEIPATRYPGRVRARFTRTTFDRLASRARKLKTRTGNLVFIALKQALPELQHPPGAIAYEVSAYMGELFIFLRLSVNDVEKVERAALLANKDKDAYVAEAIEKAFFTKTKPTNQKNLF